MTEGLNIKVHVADDRPLTPVEIAFERKICEALAASTKKRHITTRATYFVMNRSYMRSLERGETKRSAEQDASHAGGMLIGAFFAVIFTLLIVSFFGWVFNMAQVASTVSTIIAICVWLAIFSLGFGWVRYRIVALFKRALKVFRREGK